MTVGAVHESVALPVVAVPPEVDPEPEPELDPLLLLEPEDPEVEPVDEPVCVEETPPEGGELALAGVVDDEGEPPPQPDNKIAAPARPQAILSNLIHTPPGSPGA